MQTGFLRAEGWYTVRNGGDPIVSALLNNLSERIGTDRFTLWFGNSVRFAIEDETLVVGVPNHFVLERLRRTFRDPLRRACQEVLGKIPPFQFKVEESLKVPTPEPREPATKPARKNGSPPPAARRPFSTLDSFVEGTSNRLAATSAQMIIERPGSMSPLFVHGPVGVGKTHLLEGIWCGTKKAHRKARVLYLSAEQFTSEFVGSVRSGLPSFRRKYRALDLLILDDVHFFRGKRATLVELLHTIDHLLQEGKQVVLAADRPPQDLPELGVELTTRLAGGMICPIEAPDYETRLGIVRQLALEMKLEVPAAVAALIAESFASHVRELRGALNLLQATSRAMRAPISLALAKQALAPLIRHSSKVVKIPEIEQAVCEIFGVESNDLHSNKKAKNVAYPRMMAMWLARKHTRAAYSEIGDFFGRCHSTVIAAEKKVTGWVDKEASVHIGDNRVPVQEALRLVERQLGAVG